MTNLALAMPGVAFATMRDKWVDTREYFGPDRRRRAGKKPWRDRREVDEAATLPSLGHLLRRLRVQAMDLSTPDDRRHMLQILAAAINEAERTHCFRCADSLKRADSAMRLSARPDATMLDALLNEAANNAANNA